MASNRPESFARLVLIVAAAVVFATAAAAALAGGPPDFTPGGTQPGLVHRIIGADEDCVACHSSSDPDEGAYFPLNTWAGSMMAHAGRDPAFWAALDVANRDAADAGVPGVGDYCLRCHAPRAWYEGRVRKNGQGGVVDGADGCLMLGRHDQNDTVDNDFGGITCHQCHRQDPAPAGTRVHNGNLFLDDTLSCGSEPCRKGPYRYPNAFSVPHGVQGSEYVKQSEFCGTCHDVTTPTVNGAPFKLLVRNGATTTIPFPIERTYSEWRASAFGDKVFADGFAETEPGNDERRYGQTCQHCHMPQPEDPNARACMMRPSGSRAGNLPTHEFAGANPWMLRVIRSLYGTALGRVAELDRGIAAARAMLQRSASVNVSLIGDGAPGSTLSARVRVTNLSGHKLPTGYGEGRRLWLEIEASTGPAANPTVFWRSGAYDAATGTLADGDFAPRRYEVAHGAWNATTQTCETHQPDGDEKFHFVLNDCIAHDTRIPPLGFRGGNDPEIEPVGRVYPQTAPGSGVLVNYDDVSYSIPVPANASGPIRVRAHLRHQVTTKEYAEFLRDQAIERGIPDENTMCDGRREPLDVGPADQSRGAFFYAQWTQHDRSPPETVAEATATTGN